MVYYRRTHPHGRRNDAMRKEHNKLVRDRVPEIIRANGAVPHGRIISGDEYAAALKEKLSEECEEIKGAGSPDTVLDEAADILEVIDAIARQHDLTFWQVVEQKMIKQKERGSFEGRFFLEYTDE